MCTLTFVPTPDTVIITSNRDEHTSRGDSRFPVSKISKRGKIIYPQDPLAGGTWLAANDAYDVTVLLNGAFEKHSHRPPYRMSRGIVLLDSFDFPNLKAFSRDYLLDEIEPFTMVQLSTKNEKIQEVRWDGNQSYFQEFDFQTPRIWSSSTLYPLEIREQREQWFTEWLKSKEHTAKAMLQFHQFGKDEPGRNSITMDRGNGLQTVSISQIESNHSFLKFSHSNLISNTSSAVEL
jgi:hypothetical protein